MLRHLFGPFRTVNLQLFPAENPRCKHQVRVAGGVVGVQMREKRYLDVRRFNSGIAFGCGRGGTADDAGAEINQVSAVADKNRGRGARTLRIWPRSAGSKHDDLCDRLVRSDQDTGDANRNRECDYMTT